MPIEVAAEATQGRRASASRPTLRNEKINYKVREHSLAKVPVLLVVGKREADEGTLADAPPRRAKVRTVLTLAEAIALLKALKR